MRSIKEVFAIVKYLVLVFPTMVLAQKPEIKSVSKPSGNVTEIITLNGDNFGTDATKLVVFFGASKGTIESISNQVLEVRVPAGATFNNISVTNVTTGLTGYSGNQFLLSYGGLHPFDVANLQGQTDFDSEKGLYDLCMCDFDGDGKNDITTASDNATAIKFLANTSTGAGNINFNVAAASMPIGTRSLHSTCGDLNGDGKPDFVLSEGGDGNRIFVFRNTSTGPGNFGFSTQAIALPGRKTKRIAIADLDRDGKPELVITDQGSKVVSILQNTSTLANITFNATPISFDVTGAASTDGLAVKDLNGDNLPEIVVSQFLTAASNVFIIENKSTPGNISLGPINTLLLGGTVVNIRVGDLDGNGKADIAVTQLLSSGISVYLNNSTSTISFTGPISIPTEERPWGIDFGDLDGDGLADIVVPSLTKKVLTVLTNNSVPGSLSFTKQSVATTFINRHVSVGDLDGDGKADIAFTSIDDNNTGTLASKVSVFRNIGCFVPKVLPEGPLNVCAGFPLRLNSSVSRGATYEWKNVSTNTVVATGPNPYFDVIASGKYQVTAIAEGGSCSQASNIVEVTVGAGPAVGVAIASNNGPLCVGSSLQLSVTNVGATEYKWTGPNGYTGTGLNPAPIPNFQLANVGRYNVEIVTGSCVAQKVSTIVEAVDIGNFSVTYPGSTVICQGDSKVLTVSPIITGATYQWHEQSTGAIGGQTSSSTTVSATGNYFCRISYPGCGSSDTQPAAIKVASFPVANFTAPANACTGQSVQFTDNSTVDPNVTPSYLWNFGDAGTSTDKNPKHSYATASNFNVTLQVSYDGACPNTSAPKQITVQSAPIPSITNPDGKYIFCPGDNLELEVLGTYNSYLWSTGETTSSILVDEAGIYTVQVTTVSCTLDAAKDIQQHSAPMVLIAASPENIIEGETSQLNAEGLLNYDWTPVETLSASNIANPVAQPLATTEYTVTGKDINNCTGVGTIVVNVKGESIVTKLTPKNFFSPNADGQGKDTWIIDKITEYPQCGVTVYDDKGIKVFEAKPYQNNWEGQNLNGKRLPEGVYYYVIRCDGEESAPKSGSITLLR